MKSKSPLTCRWNKPQPFLFESNAPLDEVLLAMKQLGEGEDFYNAEDSIEIVASPASDRYFFQYKLNHSRKYKTSYTSAVADGQIWQANDGLIIVEGHAALTSYVIYGVGVIVAILGCLFMFTLKQIFLGCFAGLMIIGFIIWMIDWERSLVIDNIERTVNSSIDETVAS
jgi:hypothetical protein